jgi:hypothetical protein
VDRGSWIVDRGSWIVDRFAIALRHALVAANQIQNLKSKI